MKLLQRSILLLFIQLITQSTSYAEIRLPKIISSHMVLQRNTTVKLWGWSTEKNQISITASWLEEPIVTKIEKNGKWLVEIPTTNSKEPQTIEIKDRTSQLILEDVLFGEVWICSGQSNMERSFIGGKGEPTFKALETISHSNNPNLRLFTVERAGSKIPEETLDKVQSWEASNPNAVAGFSAVAYFFGSQLQKVLDVPVGLIHTSWGGSGIQAWMSEEVISEYEDFDLESIQLKEPRDARKTPTMLFNAMINPLFNYTIQGAIWYQGESNRNEPERYSKLFPAMVKDWRTRWDLGDFPFYYVQIAPYNYRNQEAFSSPANTAFLREAQLTALGSTPNSGMVVTMDLGEELNIHPPKKKEVGDRLFYNALNKTYGYPMIDCTGPIYKSHEVKNDSVIVEFSFAENGLYSPNGLQNFEIAGEDKIFYPAEAILLDRGTTLLVKSASVSRPVAVRYGWSNWTMGSLFDTNLLPASSFRTDDWKTAERNKEDN
ncbi:MAG: sialate O-acetylesterase [Cyclobacteriaceae bacterium]|jgi:sialate O-acetylesterase